MPTPADPRCRAPPTSREIPGHNTYFIRRASPGAIRAVFGGRVSVALAMPGTPKSCPSETGFFKSGHEVARNLLLLGRLLQYGFYLKEGLPV